MAVTFSLWPVIRYWKRRAKSFPNRLLGFDFIRVRGSRMTDETLLKEASRGDEAAFLVLYERHRAYVFRFAYRMLGSVVLAEDVTHDCFLSLIRRPESFDPQRASLRTYLYAATRNLSFRYLRRSGQEVAIEEDVSELRAPLAEEPLEKLLAEELSEEVRKAIESLSILQREAIVLFEYEELSLVEIAAIVGADTGTVKARLHRARQNLKRLLAPYLNSNREAVALEN